MTYELDKKSLTESEKQVFKDVSIDDEYFRHLYFIQEIKWMNCQQSILHIRNKLKELDSPDKVVLIKVIEDTIRETEECLAQDREIQKNKLEFAKTFKGNREVVLTHPFDIHRHFGR
jgi:hypothetical protein